MKVKTGIRAGANGLGDTIADITQATGIDKIARLYEEVTGKPCGCKQRQELLNNLFPYSPTHAG